MDTAIRNKQAVEAIYRTPSVRFALEHTRIESFPDQIALGKQFAQLLGPLEHELGPRLPGWFFLIVGVGEARVPRNRHDAVRDAVAAWIISNATSLDPEERTGPRGHCEVTAVPDGVPFEVTLRRDSDYDAGLLIMQRLDGDRRDQRRAAIARSLGNKCPKLAAAHDEGCISVLVLESDDVTLANRVAVAEAVVAELASRTDTPDIVVWARTSTHPWKSALLKDGDAVYPDVDGALFVLALA